MSNSTSSSSTTSSCVEDYQQCGGRGFGDTRCCLSGFSCIFQNEFYFQCIPTDEAVSESATIQQAGPPSASASADSQCIAEFEQCGGKGFGDTQCCVDGFTCIFQDEFYYQCVPTDEAFTATVQAAGESPTRRGDGDATVAITSPVTTFVTSTRAQLTPNTAIGSAASVTGQESETASESASGAPPTSETQAIVAVSASIGAVVVVVAIVMMLVRRSRQNQSKSTDRWRSILPGGGPPPVDRGISNKTVMQQRNISSPVRHPSSIIYNIDRSTPAEDNKSDTISIRSETEPATPPGVNQIRHPFASSASARSSSVYEQSIPHSPSSAGRRSSRAMGTDDKYKSSKVASTLIEALASGPGATIRQPPPARRAVGHGDTRSGDWSPPLEQVSLASLQLQRSDTVMR